MGIDTPAGSPGDSGLDPEIESILSGADSSATPETGSAAPAGQGDTPAQAASSQAQSVKLGGREYKDLSEADKAHRALHGKYSEGQHLLKWFKSNLRDPKVFSMLAKNPEWENIAGKLGLQQAREDVEAEEAAAAAQAGDVNFDPANLPPQLRPMAQYFSQQFERMEQWRHGQELASEEKELEAEIKRKLTDDEHNKVMDVIERAPSLSFKEAYTLVNHDRIIKDAVAKAGASAKPSEGGRPKPIPGMKMPGVGLDLKKDPLKMSKAEFREFWKTSPEFQKLLERG